MLPESTGPGGEADSKHLVDVSPSRAMTSSERGSNLRLKSALRIVRE